MEISNFGNWVRYIPPDQHAAEGKYGKLIFAEKVVRQNSHTIDFSKFAQLLDRIVAVLDDYETRKFKPPQSMGTGATLSAAAEL
jgi:hypothetical protein